MFVHLCHQTHVKLIDGKCPWCGQHIRWGKPAGSIVEQSTTEVVVLRKRGTDLFGHITISADAAAKGGKLAIPIQRSGAVQTIIVTIPPGVQEGTRVRLRGMGEPGPGSGPAGDLYITIHVQRPAA